VDPQELLDACGEQPGWLCERTLDWTGSEGLARFVDWTLGTPLTILCIALGAWVVSRVLQRGVTRFADSLAEPPDDDRLAKLRETGAGRLLIEDREVQRASARAATVGSVLKGVVALGVWTIAGLLVLGELDVDLAPLIAGAGIGGIALGFGAQSIVKDFLAGLFMLIEDQYGLGDIIDVGDAEGTVERMSMRSTTLRDVNGTVWHIPNGEIHRVGNFSQLWSRALIDVEVAYDTDIRAAQELIQGVADELWEDPDATDAAILDRPEVWGVQELGASAVAIRLVVKTQPSSQWAVERELRLRIKEAFDEAGIEIPFPQQTVWFGGDGDDVPRHNS